MKKELHELKQLPQGWEWYKNMLTGNWEATDGDTAFVFITSTGTYFDTCQSAYPVSITIAVLHANGFID